MICPKCKIDTLNEVEHGYLTCSNCNLHEKFHYCKYRFPSCNEAINQNLSSHVSSRYAICIYHGICFGKFFEIGVQ